MAKIKAEDVASNYVYDMARCAISYLRTQRCPGGRPIVDGSICVHCGMDTSYGDCGGVQGFTKPGA